jgi:chromosome segregation ATPase
MFPAEDAAAREAMREAIRAELSQTRQIREELAKTKREHEKQVADLQKQLDSENQKRIEGEKTIAGLRLEPDRERDLKEQHRMALNSVEKERDALKEQLTKMNGQKMLDELQVSLGYRLSKAGGSYTTAVQNLVKFEIAVMKAFGDKLPTGDMPPSVEDAAAQVKQDQVTIKALWEAIGIERVTVTGKGSDAIKKLVAIEEAFISGFHLKEGDDVLGKVNECAGQYDEYLVMKFDEEANGGVSMASMKEQLENLKKDNGTLSQQNQDAVKKVAELEKSDLMVQHILSNDGWTGIVDVDPFCARFDAELEILKQSREASGAVSNEMITDSVRNLRTEKDQLQGVIDKFKVDMAKLTNDPSQLGAELVKLKSANLDLEKTIATNSTEISNLKGELGTANDKFQKCEHELIQCQAKLSAAEHDVDSCKTRYKDDQQKIVDLETKNTALVAAQTSTGRRAPPMPLSSDPSPSELDDVVSSLLREFQLLARPAGGTSTNEKAQQIAEAINRVLDTNRIKRLK